jgi:Ligated ion channel L-glutamate- and glycine-binding site
MHLHVHMFSCPILKWKAKQLKYLCEAVSKIITCIHILQSPPYGMLKENTERLSGNDRFEGFGIDLIHDLSLMLGFNYTFVLQEDGAYGSLNRDTGEWNGMIRELHEFVRQFFFGEIVCI